MFSVIVAKLQLREARKGAAPNSAINVEHVYDALKRFLGRNTDMLAEFVQGWEDITGTNEPAFDAQAFLNNLTGAYGLSDRRRLDRGVSFHTDSRKLIAATEVLSKAFYGEFHRFRGASLEPFLGTLGGLLKVEDENIEYMRKLIKRHGQDISCIATLNYDRVVENAIETLDRPFDLGLSNWNDKRFVRFHDGRRN